MSEIKWTRLRACFQSQLFQANPQRVKQANAKTGKWNMKVCIKRTSRSEFLFYCTSEFLFYCTSTSSDNRHWRSHGGPRPLFCLGSVRIFVQKPLRNFSEGEAIGRIGTKVIFMDKNVSRAHWRPFMLVCFYTPKRWCVPMKYSQFQRWAVLF